VSAPRKAPAVETQAKRSTRTAQKDVDMKSAFERTAERFPTILSELAK
jgi:hypothetical protein